MSKYIASLILKLFGWNSTNFPDVEKCVIGVAPHTSMWDFFWGRVYIISKGYKPKILIKKEMFYFPLGIILKLLGGIPVDRSKPKGLTEMVAEKFKASETFVIAITPEGTRAKTSNWKKGFIHIARAANVPIVVGFIDYKEKELGVLDIMSPDGEVDDLMFKFKQYFTNINGKHPERFTNEHKRKDIEA
jgi:1-acyl-sn-glycerol-3-phosphate acyltransferase